MFSLNLVIKSLHKLATVRQWNSRFGFGVRARVSGGRGGARASAAGEADCGALLHPLLHPLYPTHVSQTLQTLPQHAQVRSVKHRTFTCWVSVKCSGLCSLVKIGIVRSDEASRIGLEKSGGRHYLHPETATHKHNCSLRSIDNPTLSYCSTCRRACSAYLATRQKLYQSSHKWHQYTAEDDLHLLWCWGYLAVWTWWLCWLHWCIVEIMVARQSMCSPLTGGSHSRQVSLLAAAPNETQCYLLRSPASSSMQIVCPPPARSSKSSPSIQ